MFCVLIHHSKLFHLYRVALPLHKAKFSLAAVSPAPNEKGNISVRILLHADIEVLSYSSAAGHPEAVSSEQVVRGPGFVSVILLFLEAS